MQTDSNPMVDAGSTFPHDESAQKGTAFVAPAPTELSESPIKMVTLSNLMDIGLMEENVCCCFSDPAVFKAVVENRDLLPFRLIYMEGLPKTDYSGQFNVISWPLERVSYDVLIAELASAKKIDDLKSRSEKPKGRVAAEGAAKAFAAFDYHKLVGSVDKSPVGAPNGAGQNPSSDDEGIASDEYNQ